MSSIRLFSWLLLLVGTCLIAPAFESRAGAFGRRHQGPAVCIQYVYVPVYIVKQDSGGGAAVPKVHFFLVMDTADPRLKDEISKAEGIILYLFNQLPYDHRGMQYKVNAADRQGLSTSRVVQDLKAFSDRARVQPRDTVVVYCTTHGSYQSQEAGGTKYDGGQTLQMWDKRFNEDKKTQFPGVDDLTKEQFLPRERLLDVLQNEVPGRLKMLITDACFVGEKAPRRKLDRSAGPKPVDEEPPPPEDYKPFPEVPEKDLILTDLFLNHNGLLNMNSASKDEYAIIGVFHNTFYELALGYPNYRPGLTWNSFIGRLEEQIPAKLRADLKSDPATLKTLENNPAQFDKEKKLTQRVLIFKKDDGKPAVPDYLQWEQDSKANDARRTGDTGSGGGRSEEPPPPAGFGARLATPTPASIAVHLPAGASLYLEGVPSKQNGDVRYYQTRPLARGEVVNYTFWAEYRAGDRTVSDSKVVTLRAGDDAVVKFDTLLAAATPAAPAPPAAAGVASR